MIERRTTILLPLLLPSLCTRGAAHTRAGKRNVSVAKVARTAWGRVERLLRHDMDETCAITDVRRGYAEIRRGDNDEGEKAGARGQGLPTVSWSSRREELVWVKRCNRTQLCLAVYVPRLVSLHTRLFSLDFSSSHIATRSGTISKMLSICKAVSTLAVSWSKFMWLTHQNLRCNTASLVLLPIVPWTPSLGIITDYFSDC